MKMYLNLLSIIMFFLIFFVGCEVQVKDMDAKQPALSDNTKDDVDEEQRADEPVMIGGAYLTCARLSDNSFNIGCGLVKQDTYDKIDIKDYDPKWIVVDSKEQKEQNDVVITQLPYNEPFYHIKLGYKSNSYINHIVKLELTKNPTTGQILTNPTSFVKPLAQLDKKAIVFIAYVPKTLADWNSSAILNKCDGQLKEFKFIPYQPYPCVNKKALPSLRDIKNKIFRVFTSENTEFILCSTDVNRDYVLEHYQCK